MEDPVYNFQDNFEISELYYTSPNENIILGTAQLFETFMSLEESEDTLRKNDINLHYAMSWVEQIGIVIPTNYILDSASLAGFEIENGVGKVIYSYILTSDKKSLKINIHGTEDRERTEIKSSINQTMYRSTRQFDTTKQFVISPIT